MRKPLGRILVSICLLLVCGIFAVQAQERPDFSGKWVIDISKSENLPWLNLKEYSMTVSYNRQIEQLSVKSRIREAPFAYTPKPGDVYKLRPTPLVNATYTLNGTEETVQDPAAPAVITQTALWRGDQLELRNRFETTSGDRKNRWTTIDIWQLSPDGKLLTIQQSIESPRGTQNETLVFNKQ